MSTITIPAHFDGKQIKLDEPIKLEPNTRLLVTILSQDDGERQSWLNLSLQGLESAYGETEPEYGLESLKERNPEYAGG